MSINCKPEATGGVKGAPGSGTRDGGQIMNRLELIQTPNRRMDRTDRRQCADRRRHAAPTTVTAETVATLRALLDEAHARIRTLEQAVETLKQAI